MSINAGAAMRNLGWRGFFRLLMRLPSFFKLVVRLMKDPRVTMAPKLVVAAIAAYVLLPLDFVPDFIPGLGQMDDLAVVIAGMKLFLRLCPTHVVQDHMDEIAGGR